MMAWGRVPDFGKTKAAQTMGPCPAGVKTVLPTLPVLPELQPGHRGGVGGALR